MINLALIDSMVENGTLTADQALEIRNAAKDNVAGPTNYSVVDEDGELSIINTGDEGQYTFKQAKRELRETLQAQAAEAKAAWQTITAQIKALPSLRKADVDALGVFAPTHEAVEETAE